MPRVPGLDPPEDDGAEERWREFERARGIEEDKRAEVGRTGDGSVEDEGGSADDEGATSPPPSAGQTDKKASPRTGLTTDDEPVNDSIEGQDDA